MMKRILMMAALAAMLMPGLANSQGVSQVVIPAKPASPSYSFSEKKTELNQDVQEARYSRRSTLAFERALVRAVNQSRTISFRDKVRFRMAMSLPRQRAKIRDAMPEIEEMVFQEGVLSGKIETSQRIDNVEWGDGTLLQIIIDNLPQIIDAILKIISIFLVSDEVPDGGDILPPAGNEDEKAARQFIINMANRLANSFDSTLQKFAAGQITKRQLNDEMNAGLESAFAKSREEFKAYSGGKFSGASDETIRKVLQSYVKGLER